MEGAYCDNLLFVLRSIVDENTHVHKDDFQTDIDAIFEVIESPKALDRNMLWLSRPCGTDLLPARDVFLKGSNAYIHWTHYADQPDGIRAFALALEGIKAGKVTGTLWELDYPWHVERVKTEALPVQLVSVAFEDGYRQDLSYSDYDKGDEVQSLLYHHGRCEKCVFNPESVSQLERVIAANFPVPREAPQNRRPRRDQRRDKIR